MEEKIENTIFLKYNCIHELEGIKNNVTNSEEELLRLKIQTKHWYGFSEPFLCKLNNKIEITKGTLIKIIDKLIEEEKTYINKLIDMEIEQRRVNKDG